MSIEKLLYAIFEPNYSSVSAGFGSNVVGKRACFLNEVTHSFFDVDRQADNDSR